MPFQYADDVWDQAARILADLDNSIDLPQIRKTLTLKAMLYLATNQTDIAAAAISLKHIVFECREAVEAINVIERTVWCRIGADIKMDGIVDLDDVGLLAKASKPNLQQIRILLNRELEVNIERLAVIEEARRQNPKAPQTHPEEERFMNYVFDLWVEHGGEPTIGGNYKRFFYALVKPAFEFQEFKDLDVVTWHENKFKAHTEKRRKALGWVGSRGPKPRT